MLLILFCLQFQQHQPSYVILFSRNRKPRSIMTNIATLLETAIAQALPDNWQQEPETHFPALSLIISNILLPNCCQMSNLNSRLLLTKISWRIQFMILWHASTAWAENKTTRNKQGGFIFLCLFCCFRKQTPTADPVSVLLPLQ